MAVRHTVKADDGAVDEFLHNVAFGGQAGVKCFQVLLVFQLVGGLGAAAVVRLDNDRVTNLGDKLPRRLQRRDHVVPRHRHAGLAVAFLHDAFVLDAGDEVILCAGGDVKVGAQLGVHFQPVFVVALQPVDLAVAEGEIPHRTHHLAVIAKIVDPIILGQGSLELRRDFPVGGVADAQHIDAVALEPVAEIPVAFWKMR